MTKVLALDSATEACSVALIVDGDESSIFEVSPQAHTKLLLPMVDKVLKDKGMQLCDVDVLACGQGPGSFTGALEARNIGEGPDSNLSCRTAGPETSSIAGRPGR